MLREGTVIVLGAAVSAELGFPLGGDLKSEIIKLIPARKTSMTAAQEIYVDAMSRVVGQRWFELAHSLGRGLPLAASIDNLIEHRADDAEFVAIAKLGIAAAIGSAEQGAAKAIAALPAGSSYAELFKLIVGGVGKARLVEALQRVRFVTFNYDRSLEVFFRTALEAYSGVTSAESAALVSAMDIQHVYGSLGAAPGNIRHDYGRELDSSLIADMAQDLRTFSEEVNSVSGQELKETIRTASQLIILGCANHPRNMQLLRPTDADSVVQAVYATQYIVPPEDKHSRPSMAEFAGPSIQAFRTAINQWQYKSRNRLEVTDFKVDPLTSLQLIARYGSSWVG